MKFFNIATQLYQKPWLITAEMHKQICSIVDKHLDGSAHKTEDLLNLFSEEEEKSILTKVEDIAVIDINGVLAKGVSSIMKSSGLVDLDELFEVLTEVKEDSSYNGVLLKIASPGGQVTGTPEVGKLVSEISSNIPVVVHTSDLCCSGAYWIASGATAIIASPSASIGSIGVYMTVLDRSEMFNKVGLKQELIKAGKLKGAGIDGTTLNDEQRKNFQAEVNFLHDWFRSTVRAGRGDVDDSVMEGQSLFSIKALKGNLIDKIGSLDTAMVELKDLINNTEEDTEED